MKILRYCIPSTKGYKEWYNLEKILSLLQAALIQYHQEIKVVDDIEQNQEIILNKDGTWLCSLYFEPCVRINPVQDADLLQAAGYDTQATILRSLEDFPMDNVLVLHAGAVELSKERSSLYESIHQLFKLHVFPVGIHPHFIPYGSIDDVPEEEKTKLLQAAPLQLKEGTDEQGVENLHAGQSEPHMAQGDVPVTSDNE